MAREGPGSLDGLPFVGTNLRYAADPLGTVEAAAREGDLVRIDAFGEEVLVCTDPDAIQSVFRERADRYGKPDFGGDGQGLESLLGRGLLTSEGEFWREQRGMLQSAFYREALEGYVPTMVEEAAVLEDRWWDGDVVDAYEEMARVTLRVVVRTLLGSDPTGLEGEVGDALEAVGQHFATNNLQAFLPSDVPTPRREQYRESVDRLERVLDELLRQRRDEDDHGGDVLGILLTAQEKGAVEASTIRDQLMTMLLAGHETTALTLGYALFGLSHNPEAQQRLQAEVDDVLGDERADAATVSELEFTEWVAKESMRRYPPAYDTFRVAREDDELLGYDVPEGTVIAMPQWVMHRDERYWEDPDVFDPGRWGRDVDRPEFAYFPFGGGPRRCIGDQFATTEATAILATVAQDWTIEPETEPPLSFSPAITLSPGGPIEVGLSERE